MARPHDQPIQTYEEFWLFYLREHARPATRRLHYLGTSLALLAAAGALARPWFLLLIPVGGYGPAWIAHFFVEKNRPATFRYPVWSFVSDFRMAYRRLTGRIDADLVRAGVPSVEALGRSDHQR